MNLKFIYKKINSILKYVFTIPCFGEYRIDGWTRKETESPMLLPPFNKKNSNCWCRVIKKQRKQSRSFLIVCVLVFFEAPCVPINLKTRPYPPDALFPRIMILLAELFQPVPWVNGSWLLTYGLLNVSKPCKFRSLNYEYSPFTKYWVPYLI